MHIWSILWIESDLKRCIHLIRSLFLYLKPIQAAVKRNSVRFSVGWEPDYESQSCRFESHCGHDFFLILYIVVSFAFLAARLSHYKWNRTWYSSDVKGAKKTRGPKGHISCTWVPCATFLTDPPGRPFLFTDWPQNRILEEDVRILLSVKFHWIPFSGFRGKVENVSVNQRQGVAILLFSIGPKI